MSEERRLPVVAVTSWHSGLWPIDSEHLAAQLADLAEVVAIPTGEVTYELADALPDRLDVFGGATRIWWPKLTQSSNPHDHPLLLIRAKDEVGYIVARVLAAIRDQDATAGRFGPWIAPATPGSLTQELPQDLEIPSIDEFPARTRNGRPVLRATVMSIENSGVRLCVGPQEGWLAYTDQPLITLAARLSVGQTIPVFEVADQQDSGSPSYSTQGLIGRAALQARSSAAPGDPAADAWPHIANHYKVGDVVRGRVCRIRSWQVLVEVLPGVALPAHKSQLDFTYITDPSSLFSLGECVKVKILDLDPLRRTGSVSIKQALTDEPLPPVTVWAGQSAFLAGSLPIPPGPEAPTNNDVLEHEVRELRSELAAVSADRKALRRREQDLRRELRQRDQRSVSSPAAFLLCVRLSYATCFTDADQCDYPMLELRVHPEFINSVRRLEGIDLDKIIEVCSQVGCGRAHSIPAREVHLLRSGEAGGLPRLRKRDSAKAYRCSLQDGTAGARRLHWWEIPGRVATSRVIEFASVGVHDDMDIPE